MLRIENQFGQAAAFLVAAIFSIGMPESLSAAQSGGRADPATLERQALAAERRGDYVAALQLYEQAQSDSNDTQLYNRVMYRLEALADIFTRDAGDAARQGDRLRAMELYAHGRRAASRLGASFKRQVDIEQQLMRLVGESREWPPFPRPAADLADAAQARAKRATTASELFDATQELRQAIDQAPWDPRLWYNLALLYEAEGDVKFATRPNGASSDYSRAVDALELYALGVPPDGPEAQRRIAALKAKQLPAQERECRLYEYGWLSCWGAAEEHARRGNLQVAATYLDVGCRVRQMDQMCAGGEIRRKLLGR